MLWILETSVPHKARNDVKASPFYFLDLTCWAGYVMLIPAWCDLKHLQIKSANEFKRQIGLKYVMVQCDFRAWIGRLTHSLLIRSQPAKLHTVCVWPTCESSVHVLTLLIKTQSFFCQTADRKNAGPLANCPECGKPRKRELVRDPKKHTKASCSRTTRSLCEWHRKGIIAIRVNEWLTL